MLILGTAGNTVGQPMGLAVIAWLENPVDWFR
jgi:hypothetical protein